jgi:hypothetical protein
MAQYKDTFLLIDKVSKPLQKIQIKMKGVQEIASRAQDKLLKFQNGAKKIGKVASNTAKAVGTVASAVGVLGTAIIANSNKYADIGDRIDKMSQKIGMSKKAFQEWDYIMSQNGGNVETLQMGFKTLVTQIEGVQKGSKDSIRAFADLGVAVKDSSGQFRNQDDIFNDTIRKLQKIQNPTKKAMLANRLFGRSAAELRPLLNQEASAIDELRTKANSMGLIISDKDIKNAVIYKDTMDTFSRFFEAKFASLMMSVMPDLTNTLEKIIQLVEENQNVFNNLGLAIKWIGGTALPFVIKGLLIIPKILNNIGSFVGNIIGTIMSIPTAIQTAISNILTSIIIFLNPVIEKISVLLSGIKKIQEWRTKESKKAADEVAKGVSSSGKVSNNSNVYNNNNSRTYNINANGVDLNELMKNKNSR